ncbi:hypothetical protein AHAS_Ahas01G0283600 [Arachis hypogaea]
MCRSTNYKQQNLDGCGSLLLLGHIIASLPVDPTNLIRGGFLWSRGGWDTSRAEILRGPEFGVGDGFLTTLKFMTYVKITFVFKYICVVIFWFEQLSCY